VARYLPYLGFLIPESIAKPEGSGGHDSGPRVAVCDRCKRMKLRTYLLWNGQRMCWTDLDESVKARLKGRTFAKRRRVDGDEGERMDTEPRFDFEFWAKYLP
jgi:hypothetical protein